MSELHRVEWNHPRHGRISETVCERHERELLGALTKLGIGCQGSLETERRHCSRCLYSGLAPREWLLLVAE